MYTKHLENCTSKKDKGIAVYFNPMKASATIAKEKDPKHADPVLTKKDEYVNQGLWKLIPRKIWNGISVVGGKIYGNQYIKEKHGLLGTEREKWMKEQSKLKQAKEHVKEAMKQSTPKDATPQELKVIKEQVEVKQKKSMIQRIKGFFNRKN